MDSLGLAGKFNYRTIPLGEKLSCRSHGIQVKVPTERPGNSARKMTLSQVTENGCGVLAALTATNTMLPSGLWKAT